jgi:hypothetical protein
VLGFSAQNVRKLVIVSQLQVSQGFNTCIYYMRKKYFKIRKECSLVTNIKKYIFQPYAESDSVRKSDNK